MRKDNTWDPELGRVVREGFRGEVPLELNFFFFTAPRGLKDLSSLTRD